LESFGDCAHLLEPTFLFINLLPTTKVFIHLFNGFFFSHTS